MSIVGKHQRLMTKLHQFYLKGVCHSLKQNTTDLLQCQTTCPFNQQISTKRFFTCLLQHKPVQNTIAWLKQWSNQYSGYSDQNVSPADVRDIERVPDAQRSPMKKNLKVNETNTAEHLGKIAEVLSCSVEEVKKLTVRNRFLFHLQPQLLQEKVQLLLSYGISQSDIDANIRICYKISAKLLEERLKLMMEQSLLDGNSVRFLESETEDFNRAVEYISKKREALEGCATISEYIQHRLQCTEIEARKVLSSPPFSKGYTSIKLKALLDFFLLEAKVDSQFLLEHSFLFTFSVKRLRHRLKIMNAAGIKDPLKMKAIWFYPTEKFNCVFKKYIMEN